MRLKMLKERMEKHKEKINYNLKGKKIRLGNYESLRK